MLSLEVGVLSGVVVDPALGRLGRGGVLILNSFLGEFVRSMGVQRRWKLSVAMLAQACKRSYRVTHLPSVPS